MTWEAALVIAFAFGTLSGWWSRRGEVQRLWGEVETARAERREASDRLVQAWRDGYHVPEPAAEPFVEPPLSAPLQALVASYPDPIAAAKVEAAIRRKVNSGRSEDAILMDAEVGQL